MLLDGPDACAIRLIHGAAQSRRYWPAFAGQAAAEKLAFGEEVVEWADRVGDSLDDLPDREHRAALQLILDAVAIDGENNVTSAPISQRRTWSQLEHQ